MMSGGVRRNRVGSELVGDRYTGTSGFTGVASSAQTEARTLHQHEADSLWWSGPETPSCARTGGFVTLFRVSTTPMFIRSNYLERVVGRTPLGPVTLCWYSRVLSCGKEGQFGQEWRGRGMPEGVGARKVKLRREKGVNRKVGLPKTPSQDFLEPVLTSWMMSFFCHDLFCLRSWIQMCHILCHNLQDKEFTSGPWIMNRIGSQNGGTQLHWLWDTCRVTPPSPRVQREVRPLRAPGAGAHRQESLRIGAACVTDWGACMSERETRTERTCTGKQVWGAHPPQDNGDF